MLLLYGILDIALFAAYVVYWFEVLPACSHVLIMYRREYKVKHINNSFISVTSFAVSVLN